MAFDPKKYNIPAGYGWERRIRIEVPELYYAVVPGRQNNTEDKATRLINLAAGTRKKELCGEDINLRTVLDVQKKTTGAWVRIYGNEDGEWILFFGTKSQSYVSWNKKDAIYALYNVESILKVQKIEAFVARAIRHKQAMESFEEIFTTYSE